jgi:hypothetical protein
MKKTSVVITVEHPDEIAAVDVAGMVDRCVGIGYQDALDTMEDEGDDAKEDASKVVKLTIYDSSVIDTERLRVKQIPSPVGFSKDADTIRDAIDAFADVLAMTFDPDDQDEPHPDFSAADVFEAVCNLNVHIEEARQAINRLTPPQQPVNVQVLKAMLDLLAIAEQGEPADEDERAALEAARVAARAAKAEACEPCDQCTAAEQLCEGCGGHGVVPKAAPDVEIVVSCSGGVVTAVYCSEEKAGVEIVDFDEFEGEDQDPEEALDEATEGLTCVY